jgi:ribonuclease PH
MRDTRSDDELRHVTMETGAAPYAEGSCLIAAGNTRVLCTASVQESVPEWREGRGLGWVTAEYAMLPRATHTRSRRERSEPRGRTQEIQRLIGRSLRSVVNFEALGPRTIILDCDVLQADGGTRTAAITGAWVALALACRQLRSAGLIEADPLTGSVAAVSAGVVGGRHLLDLEYREDVSADLDMNVVGAPDGRLIEVQGTAEGDPFPRTTLDRLLDLSLAGIEELGRRQAAALESAPR